MDRTKAGFWNIIIRATGSILGTLLFDFIARKLFYYDVKLENNPVLLWGIRLFVFFLCYFVLRIRDGRREAEAMRGESGFYAEDEYEEEEYTEEYEGDYEEEYIEEEYSEEDYEEEEYYEEDCEEEEDYEEEYSEEDYAEDDCEEDDIEDYREEITEMTESVKVIFRQRNSIMLQAQKMMQSGNGNVALEMAMHENNEKCGRTSGEIQKLLARLSKAKKVQDVERILYNIQKHLDVVRSENQRVLSQINHLLVKQKERMQEEQMREEEYSRGDEEIDESLFRGCTDKESLSKRYRNLMKTFHPDNADGDLEMTQRIKKTYEELVKRYS